MNASSMEYTTTVSVFKLIDDVWTPQFDAQWLLMVFRKENCQLWLELYHQDDVNTSSIASSPALLRCHIRHVKEWMVVAEDYVEFVTTENTSIPARYGFYFESPEATTSTSTTISQILASLSEVKPPPPPTGPKRRRSLAEFAEVEQLAAATAAPSEGPLPTPPPMIGEADNSRPSSQQDDSSISLPLNVNHTMKVTFDAKWSRYIGLPNEWRSYNKQFGVALSDLPKVRVEGYAGSIPTVLVMLNRLFVAMSGSRVVGIFRIAPDKDQCQAVKDAINSGSFTGEGADVHVIANLIKVFFRDLPDGLFNAIPTPTIYQLAEADLNTVIATLPQSLSEDSYSLVYYLLDLMASVVMEEHVNKMSARNMSIVVSPNLYTVSTENPMVALTTAQKVADFTTNVLLARLQMKFSYSPSNNNT